MKKKTNVGLKLKLKILAYILKENNVLQKFDNFKLHSSLRQTLRIRLFLYTCVHTV